MKIKLSLRELEIVNDILDRYFPSVPIWVFGSRVSGESKPFSDLDLSIITTSPISFSILGKAKAAFIESAFLKDFRDLATEKTRGCIVLEHPDLLKELAEKHGARDTTMRNTAYEELGALSPKKSQHDPGFEIPEKNLVYKLSKKLFFNDFGVYAKQKK